MLKKVDLLARGETDGAYYVHLFRPLAGGPLLRVEISFDEYMALREKNAAQPVAPDGYVYEQSEGAHRFDTPSGRLEDGCYCDDGESVMVTLNGEYNAIAKPFFDKMLAAHEGSTDAAVDDRSDYYAIPVACSKVDGSLRVTKDAPLAGEMAGEVRFSKEVVAAVAEAKAAEIV